MQETWDLGLIPGSGRFLGGGNGKPLQYACLGNPTDRGAWQAAVHGVAERGTWLADWPHTTQDVVKLAYKPRLQTRTIGLIRKTVITLNHGHLVWLSTLTLHSGGHLGKQDLMLLVLGTCVASVWICNMSELGLSTPTSCPSAYPGFSASQLTCLFKGGPSKHFPHILVLLAHLTGLLWWMTRLSLLWTFPL